MRGRGASQAAQAEQAGQAVQVVPAVPHTEEQRRLAAMAVSLLLRYPEAGNWALFEDVEKQLPLLPQPVAAALGEFLNRAAQLGPLALQEHYVETFDQRRRCSLNLSYYAVGDTRQRGAAILAFRQQLEALGVEEISEELPDHLCVVLEALALTDAAVHDQALAMVASHRDGIEVLRNALAGLDSPYERVLAALCMALPEMDPETVDRYINLIRQGPPAEMVGLDTTPLPFPTAVPQH